MRRYIYIIAMMVVVAITSCTKDLEPEDNSTPSIDKEETLVSKSRMITISLSSPSGIETRAFFDDSAALESWEGEIRSASLFIYKAGESYDYTFVARKDLTDQQLSDMRLTFAVDDVEDGDILMVAGVANNDIPQGVTSIDDLVTYAYDGEITEYNGSFLGMCSGSLREDGFELLGESDYVVAGESAFSTFNVLFQPIVSKVAMQLTVADDFNDRYPGDIRVNSVTASNVYLQVPFFGTPEYCAIVQEPNIDNGVYQNLFYLYPYSAPIFVVDATYDLDGDFATTDDQTPMSYNVRLTNDSGNEESIAGSTYYRISGTIVGLSGAGVVLQLSVSDWTEVRDFDIIL
ncbi:MAG: hypothetical protein SNI87_07105 [Rikenellaceae bacterium]